MSAKSAVVRIDSFVEDEEYDASKVGWPTFSGPQTPFATPPFSNRGSEDGRSDHFITRDGVRCAGTHLIADFWGAKALTDLEHMEQALRCAALEGGATLLHIHLHHFSENDGISGVAVLAESHISVHTWPERDYAAFDVFMCGDARPHDSVKTLERFFQPNRVNLHDILRGRVLPDD